MELVLRALVFSALFDATTKYQEPSTNLKENVLEPLHGSVAVAFTFFMFAAMLFEGNVFLNLFAQIL